MRATHGDKLSFISGFPCCVLVSFCGFYVTILLRRTKKRRPGPGNPAAPHLYMSSPYMSRSSKAKEKQTEMKHIVNPLTEILPCTPQGMPAHLRHTWYSPVLFHTFIVLHDREVIYLRSWLDVFLPNILENALRENRTESWL